MEYITYAHLLNGEVYQIGNFGAVALWFEISGTRLSIGCRRVKTWMTYWQSLKVVCGDYTINSPPKEGNVFSMNSFLSSMTQSIQSFCLNVDGRASVLGDRDEQAWYLVYIGTRPDSRGKGYARKLVEHITTKVRRTPVCRNQPGSPTTIPICYQDDADC